MHKVIIKNSIVYTVVLALVLCQSAAYSFPSHALAPGSIFSKGGSGKRTEESSPPRPGFFTRASKSLTARGGYIRGEEKEEGPGLIGCLGGCSLIAVVLMLPIMAVNYSCRNMEVQPQGPKLELSSRPAPELPKDQIEDVPLPQAEASKEKEIVTNAFLGIRALYDDESYKRKAIRQIVELGPPAVPYVIKGLWSKDDRVFIFAGEVLGKMGSIAIEGLEKALLSGEDRDVRGYAAEVLGNIKDKASVKALMKAADDPNDHVRMCVTQALWYLRDPESREVFYKAIKDPDEKIRQFGVYAMAYYRDPRGIESLREVLEKDKVLDIRLLAAQTLGEFKDARSVEALHEALANDDEALVRLMAARSLGNINDPASVEPLAKALNDPDEYVQSSAAISLAGYKDGRCLEKLVATAASNRGENLGDSAQSLLPNFSDPRSIKYLVESLDVPEDNTRAAAEEALIKIGAPAAGALREALDKYDFGRTRKSVINIIIEIRDPEGIRKIQDMALKDANWLHREDAVNGLKNIKERDVKNIGVLIKALKDSHHSIRWAAAAALGEIGDERACKALCSLLKHDKENDVRCSAAVALGQLRDPDGVETLCETALNDRDETVRLFAVQSLGWVKSKSGARTLKAVFVKEKDFKVRDMAIASMGRAGYKECVDVLIAALEDNSFSVRLYAASALAELKDRKATGPLIKVLSKLTEEDDIIQNAASALHSLKDPDSLKPLMKLASPRQRITKSSIQYGAMVALMGLKSPETADLFSELLREKDVTTRYLAVKALGGIKTERSAYALSRALITDDNPYVRAAATVSLRQLKDKAGVTALINALDDEDEVIRSGAAMALAEIKDPESIPPLLEAMKGDNVRVHIEASRALSNFLIDPAFSEQHEKIMAALFDYLAGDVLDLPLDMLKQIKTRPMLIANLACRGTEIAKETLSPSDIITIYNNGAFASATKDLDASGQFSVARAIELTLKRFSLPAMDGHIEKILPAVIKARERYADRVILDKSTNLIIMCHQDPDFDPSAMASFANGFGVKNILKNKGALAKGDFLNAVTDCRVSATIVLNSIWMSGHGGPKHFWLDKGLLGTEKSEDLHNRQAVSYKELADALRNRAKKTNGVLSDMNIIVDDCYSSDQVIKALNILADDVAKGTIKDLPVIVSATNIGAVGYLNVFFDNVRASSQGKSALTLRDIMNAETGAMAAQDFAYFFNMPKDEFVALKEALKVAEAETVEGMLSVKLPVINNYVPVVQPGGFELGERIGDGLVFNADASGEDIAAGLIKNGIPITRNTEKVFTVMQRYFRCIRARAPDKTVDFGAFKLEFRKNVKHYAAIEGNKFIVDVALLGMQPRILLPALSFVLGHESSHRLKSVGSDESKAQAMDEERFRAYSAHHRRSVIEFLKRLNAEKAYLERLERFVTAPAETFVPYAPSLGYTWMATVISDAAASFVRSVTEFLDNLRKFVLITDAAAAFGRFERACLSLWTGLVFLVPDATVIYAVPGGMAFPVIEPEVLRPAEDVIESSA